MGRACGMRGTQKLLLETIWSVRGRTGFRCENDIR